MLILPEPERGPSSPFRLAWRAVRVWLIGVVFTVALAAVIEFTILPVGRLR